MNSNQWESSKAKVDRANYHLEQLKVEVRAENAHGFIFKHEVKTNDLVLYASIPHELFIRYSIIAGEVIHHARSALEHAIWEMVPASKRTNRTGFPVFTVKSGMPNRDYDSRGRKMIDGINISAAV